MHKTSNESFNCENNTRLGTTGQKYDISIIIIFILQLFLFLYFIYKTFTLNTS